MRRGVRSRSSALWLAFPMAVFACALPSVDEYARGSADAGALPGDGGTTSSGSASNGSTSSGSTSSGSTSSSGGTSSSGSTSGTTPDGGSFTNLISSAGFEDGTCGPAAGFQSAIGSTNTAHSGDKACQVCRSSESLDFYTWNSFTLVEKPKIGQKYRAHAWVRRGAESFKDQTIEIALRIFKGDSRVDEVYSAPINLEDDWSFIETSLTIKQDADTLDLFVASRTAATAGERCFIVDDIAAWLE